MTQTLQFRSEKSSSIAPKLSIIAWYLLCGGAAVWLTFGASSEWNRPGNPLRQITLLVFTVTYIARAGHTLFVFVKRKVPWWEAAWGGSLIGCVIFFFLMRGLRVQQPLGPVDLAGALLYIAGS